MIIGLLFIICILYSSGRCEMGTDARKFTVPITTFFKECSKVKPKCYLNSPSSVKTIHLDSLVTSGHYSVSDSENNTILLNICQPLPAVMCQSVREDIGACLTRVTSRDLKNRGTPVGKFTPDVLFVDNHFRIIYPAVEGSNFSTEIVFLCSTFSEGTGELFMEYKEDSSTFKVFWYTHLACLSHDKGIFEYNRLAHFNLSSLTKSSGYYRIHMNRNDGDIFLNPFQPLSFGHGELCEREALACLNMNKIETNGTESKKDRQMMTIARRVGDFQVLDNETLAVVFDEGDSCTICPSTKMSLKIIFRFALVEMLPVFTGLTDFNCQVVVEWSTTFSKLIHNDLTNPHQPIYGPTGVLRTAHRPISNGMITRAPVLRVTESSKGSPIEGVFEECGLPLAIAAAVGCFLGLMLTVLCVTFFYCCCKPICCPYFECFSPNRRASIVIDCCCFPSSSKRKYGLNRERSRGSGSFNSRRCKRTPKKSPVTCACPTSSSITYGDAEKSGCCCYYS